MPTHCLPGCATSGLSLGTDTDKSSAQRQWFLVFLTLFVSRYSSTLGTVIASKLQQLLCETLLIHSKTL